MDNLKWKAMKGVATVYPKCIHSYDGYCEKTGEHCGTVICDDDNNNNVSCDMAGYEPCK